MIIKDTSNKVNTGNEAEKDTSQQSQSISAIPTGGYTGQVLAKKSNVDGDTYWSNSGSGGGTPPGGTTGQVLAKMSDLDGDVTWITPSGVSSVNGKSNSNITLNQDEIPDGTNYKRYSQAEKTKLSNITGTNTGDETTSTIKTKLGAGSASADGYITSTDWNEFNGKQANLVSGTNIKTINGTSVLGSGDIVVSGGSGVTVYADLAALKAVDTTAYTDVQTVQVATLGLYKFQPLSTLTGDDINVITPTKGSSAGRWIKQSKDVTSVLEAYSATYKNVSTVLENSEILKLKGNKLGKTIKVVEIGSSVLKGSGATTLAQGYANLLATELSAITEVSISTVNLGVASNTAGSVRDRFDDIVINNPDVLIIGVSTNNSSLYTANAYSSGALMVKTYLRQLSELVALCETRGISYFIVGEYGYTGATSYGINLKKQLNAQLCKFKNYLNVLGEVADDSCAWKSSAQYDAGHPNDVGHLGMLRGIIREHIYTSNKLKLDFKPQKGYGVIQSGTDSATSAPLMFTPSAWSASALESWTLTFGVRLGTGNYTASRCLLKTKPTNTLAGVGIDVNTSGYITCRDGATLKATSSVKIDTIKEAKIVITSDVIDNLIYIYVNGELLSSFTPANGLGLYNAFVARDNLDVNTRATGYEFNNFVIYQGRMDLYNIQRIFKNDYPQSNITFCHNLDCDSIEGALFSQNNNGSYCVSGFAGSILSSNIHDNIYTDLDKKKVASLNTVGTAVASATTITAPSTIFHVTGTTAISTITVPYTGFTGNITIIPDAIFTLATGGNIYEAYTAVVGRAIQLCYDGTTWYRVNAT